MKRETASKIYSFFSILSAISLQTHRELRPVLVAKTHQVVRILVLCPMGAKHKLEVGFAQLDVSDPIRKRRMVPMIRERYSMKNDIA